MSATIESVRNYLDVSEIDIVIYHANCFDGFGAAFAIWSATSNESTEYIPISHYSKYEKIQNIFMQCENKNVVLLDFCFKVDMLKQLNTMTSKLIVLDHHSTTLEQVQQANMSEYCVLNIDKSGCGLAWEYCYNDRLEMPWMLKYIQDRDLFRWEYEDTKYFTESFYRKMTFDFKEWLMFQDAENDTTVLQDCIEDGKTLLKYEEKELAFLVSKAENIIWNVGGTNYNIYVLNSNSHTSKIGNILAKDVDFAMVWLYDHKKNFIKIALRSDAKGNNVNVARIAEHFGGGGHANASGFVWKESIEKLLAPIQEIPLNSTSSEFDSSEMNTTQYNENTSLLENSHESQWRCTFKPLIKNGMFWTSTVFALLLGAGVATSVFYVEN